MTTSLDELTAANEARNLRNRRKFSGEMAASGAAAPSATRVFNSPVELTAEEAAVHKMCKRCFQAPPQPRKAPPRGEPAKAVHTPGPWKRSNQVCEGGFKIIGSNNESVCVCSATVKLPSETKEANARLIASAPETAAELERVKQQIAETEEALRMVTKQREDYWQQRDELLAEVKDLRAGPSIVRAQRDQARRRSDELLAALKLGADLQREGDIWSVNPGKMRAFLDAARAAIANAEKEAK